MMTSGITSGVQASVTAALLGTEEVTEEKQYALLMQAPKAVRACECIGRLINDIVSSEAELARGCRQASSIQCYMKDYNKNKEEVLQMFHKKVENAWKDLIEERLLINPIFDGRDHFSKPVFDRIHNYARVLEVFYQLKDGFSLPEDTIKGSIISIYDQPFSI